jgi:hypothetical protein
MPTALEIDATIWSQEIRHVDHLNCLTLVSLNLISRPLQMVDNMPVLL